MSDEIATTNPSESPATTSDPPATPPAGSASGQPAERMLPQSEVDRIVQRRLEQDRARRAPAAPAPRPASQTTTNSNPSADDGQSNARARERAFDRAALKLELNDTQAGIMEAEAIKQGVSPGEMTEWCQRFAGDVFGKQPVSTTTTVPAAAPSEPAKPPAAAPSSSQPSAVSPITTGGLVDIYTLTPEQFAAYTPQQLREHHERNVSAANSRHGAPPIPKQMQKR